MRFWPRFGRLRPISKILKDSYNPRLKSVVLDRWFDMFTGSRLMAVTIKFHLRRNSGSIRRFGAQSCSDETQTVSVFQDNLCAKWIPRATQLPVTGRVLVDNVKLRTSFLARTLGVDRYVFFRADTDTDYYRSSRPITDILNRYTCLV